MSKIMHVVTRNGYGKAKENPRAKFIGCNGVMVEDYGQVIGMTPANLVM